VQLLRCALCWQIVDNQRLVSAGDLLISGSLSRTRLRDRINKTETIKSERIEILYIRKISSYYITINGIFKLELFIKLSDRSSKNSDFRIIRSANLRILYLNIRVDVISGVSLMCEKSPVMYTAKASTVKATVKSVP